MKSKYTLALTLITGAAIGSAAVEVLHAQGKATRLHHRGKSKLRRAIRTRTSKRNLRKLKPRLRASRAAN
jgi:hypothetical protein